MKDRRARGRAGSPRCACRAPRRCDPADRSTARHRRARQPCHRPGDWRKRPAGHRWRCLAIRTPLRGQALRGRIGRDVAHDDQAGTAAALGAPGSEPRQVGEWSRGNFLVGSRAVLDHGDRRGRIGAGRQKLDRARQVPSSRPCRSRERMALGGECRPVACRPPAALWPLTKVTAEAWLTMRQGNTGGRRAARAAVIPGTTV